MRSKRPVTSGASAEVLGISTSHEGIILQQAYRKPLGVNLGLFVIVDTNDIYDTIYAKRLSTDKAIKGDVAFLR